MSVLAGAGGEPSVWSGIIFLISFVHYFTVQTFHELACGCSGDEVLDGFRGAKCINVIVLYTFIKCPPCDAGWDKVCVAVRLVLFCVFL